MASFDNFIQAILVRLCYSLMLYPRIPELPQEPRETEATGPEPRPEPRHHGRRLYRGASTLWGITDIPEPFAASAASRSAAPAKTNVRSYLDDPPGRLLRGETAAGPDAGAARPAPSGDVRTAVRRPVLARANVLPAPRGLLSCATDPHGPDYFRRWWSR